MKRISILGDSICTFEGYNAPGYYIYYDKVIQKENDISSVSDMWWYKVIAYLVYKDAVFDTNRKSLLRHISAEKGLK